MKAASSTERDMLDPREYAIMFKNNWWLIALFCLAAALAAFVVTNRQVPLYEAESEVILEFGAPSQTTWRQDLLAFNPWDDTFVQTHTRLVTSEHIVRQAAKLLRAEMAGQPATIPAAEQMVAGVVPPLPTATMVKLRAHLTGKNEHDVEAEIAGGLDVSFLKKTRIMRIAVRSVSPDFSMAASRAVISSYATYIAETFASSSEKQFAKLQKQAQDAASSMESSSIRLLSVKKTAEENLLTAPLREGSTNDERVMTIMQRLALDNEDAVKLMRELGEAENEIAMKEKRYGPKHPEMQALIQRRDFLKAETEDLKLRIYQQWVQRHAKEQQDMEIQAVEQEASAARKLHDLILTKMKDVDLSAKTSEVTLRVLKSPATPQYAVTPNKPKNLAFGGAVGLLAGLLAMLIREYNKSQKVSLKAASLLPCETIGQVPHISDGKELNSLFGGERLMTPSAEAVKALRTTVLSLLERCDSRVIMITSPGRGDGKSTVTTALARSISQLGKRVLLLDFDLRRGRINRILDQPQEPGLSSFLSGNGVPLPIDVGGGLFFISCGKPTHHAAELLSGSRMENLVRDWQKEFDVVVFDTPPLLLITDASILSRFAGLRLMVARSRHTRLQACQQGASILQQLGTPLNGVVINGVGSGDDRYYGGYYSYYYYSKDNSPDD